MADARETFYPVEIQRDYQGQMRILWDDGHECLYPYSELRKVCPCAVCRELRGQQVQAPANPFPGGDYSHHPGCPPRPPEHRGQLRPAYRLE